MRQSRWFAVLLVMALWPAVPAHALVDPVLTTQTVPDWMAEIRVAGGSDGQFHEFCKGALIAPQWVLSSGRCLADPNHYLEGVSSYDDLEFLVKLGHNGDSVEVEKFYFSDDYSLALFRIALPAGSEPLPLGTQSAAQLTGRLISIVGREKSVAVANDYYNPGIAGTPATCKMGSSEFFVAGALCYVQTSVTSSVYLYKTTGTVIDPASPSAPSSALDRAAILDTSGKELYVDFRAALSYPCLEDIGLPLLGKTADGGDEIVGVVAGVGMAARLPVCGMTLANEFVSAAAIRRFVDNTYARYDFAARCPATPAPTVSFGSGGAITLQWKAVKGASGYKVHYTTRQGQVPALAVDARTRTTITTTLAHDTDYLVAVSAYNGNCSSALSKPLAVNVDVH